VLPRTETGETRPFTVFGTINSLATQRRGCVMSLLLPSPQICNATTHSQSVPACPRTVDGGTLEWQNISTYRNCLSIIIPTSITLSKASAPFNLTQTPSASTHRLEPSGVRPFQPDREVRHGTRRVVTPAGYLAEVGRLLPCAPPPVAADVPDVLRQVGHQTPVVPPQHIASESRVR